MMTNKHPYVMRSGIIAATAGTVAGGLVLSFIPQFRGFLIELMLWVWAGISWTWTFLISDHSVPGWAFLIIGLLALAGITTIGVVICAALSPKSEPEYMNYTEDMLYGAKWRWSWVGGRISNLWCFCPICDAQLVYAEGFGETNFICERCPSGEPDHLYPSHGRVVATVRGGDRYYAVSAAEREVFRRIRTGEKVSSND